MGLGEREAFLIFFHEKNRKREMNLRIIVLVGMLLSVLFVGEVHAAAQQFEVQKKTAIYASAKDGLQEIGQLEQGIVLPFTKETTNYFLLEHGEKTYYIEKASAVVTEEKVNTEKHIKGSYPRDIIATEHAKLYTKSGQHIGSLQKGQQVTVHMTVGERGVIELFGARLYVDLAQFKHTNQIYPQKNISYEEMVYHLRVFSMLYPQWTKLEEIGQSVEGRPLYALHVGTGNKQLLLDGAIHAREHMTTNVLLEMIDEYSKSYIDGNNYGAYNTHELLSTVTLTFIPMLNPDGVKLVQEGYSAIQNGDLARKINGSTSIKRWKANARGVDLNRNFEVGNWQAFNAPTKPASKNAKGPKPFSEPEAVALRDFIRKQNFGAYLSYHSSGQIIFYHYNQTGAQHTRDLAFAKKIAKATGYSLISPKKNMKTAASQDWFIAEFKKPALTIEISPSVGDTVVPLSNWPRIWAQQKYVGLLAAKEI